MTKQSTNKYLNNTFLDHLTENQHKLEKYALCPCSLYPRISPLGKEINKPPVRNPFQFNGHQTFLLINPHWLFILHHLSQAQSLRTRNPQYQTARPIASTNAST
jgi:hypothetical protein